LKLFILGAIGVWLLTTSVWAMSHSVNDKKMTISYVVYPQVEGYVALIKDVYTELGFKVTLLSTPSTRGLILLNAGEVDADVVRVRRTVEQYPNAVLVEPALKVGKLVLLCRKDVICETSVLHSKNEVLLSSDAVTPYLAKLKVSARIVKPQGNVNVVDMLKAQRADYAFFLIDGQIDFTPDFNMVDIQEISVFHVIHKKHAAMLPLIQQKIIEKLPEFNAQFDKNSLSKQ
jgi:hypothetical protein